MYTRGVIATMLSLMRRRALTESAAGLRQRAREVGASLPDLRAQSAHTEVELSKELEDAARDFYVELQEHAADPSNGHGASEQEAEAKAEAEDRDLITLDL